MMRFGYLFFVMFENYIFENMETTKLAIEWAKDEIYSSMFFIYFALVFFASAFGFWQIGKTETAKAFVYPLLVCGVLLLIIGSGLVYSNISRIKSFGAVSQDQISGFVQTEISRADKTIADYEIVIFKVIPCIILVAALMLIFLHKPFWQGIAIVTIAMMVVILVIDSNASSRMKNYKGNLAATSSSVN